MLNLKLSSLFISIFIGMLFRFSVPGQVYISMGNTISEFLAEVNVGDDARAESPAVNYLFNIDDDAQLLN